MDLFKLIFYGFYQITIKSGQIIAGPSHDRFPPNGGLVREMGPLISGKSRLVKYYNLARLSEHLGEYCLLFPRISSKSEKIKYNFCLKVLDVRDFH